MARCIIKFLISKQRVVYLTVITRAFGSIQTNQPLVYYNNRTLLPYKSPSFHQFWNYYDNNNYNNYNNNNKFDIPQTDFPEATTVAASGFACTNTQIIILCKCDSEAVINKWLEGMAWQRPLTHRQVSCTQNMNWVYFNSSVSMRQWVLSYFPFSLFWHFCTKKYAARYACKYNIEI